MTTEERVRNCAEIAVRNERILNLPNADEPYYKFLACLVREFAPHNKAFEIGVYQGTGLAHLALGLFVQVFGVDIDISRVMPTIAEMATVNLIQMDSIEYLKTLGTKSILRPIFHLDTKHIPSQVHAELVQACRVGIDPIICIDDVTIDQDMTDWWQQLHQVDGREIIKIDLPKLHVTGYGVVLLK